jgi:hypothetical protein
VTPCPIFGIAITKSKMTVSGFVLVDVAIQRSFIDIIRLTYSRNKMQIEALVKLPHVLRECLLKLKAENGGLQHSYKIDIQAKLPAHTSFTRPDGVEMETRCVSRVIEWQECPGSSLYYAEGLEGFDRFGSQIRKLVVKFVETYSQGAHSSLAKKGLAPKLHFVGRIPGGLQMIVMDRIVGTSADQDARMTKSEFEDITGAIGILHSQKIAFGDLRLPNIMMPDAAQVEGVDVASSAETPRIKLKAMLIDFDWCGSEDQTCYPHHINMVQIHWPVEVGPGAQMKMRHNLEMLQDIRTRHCASFDG